MSEKNVKMKVKVKSLKAEEIVPYIQEKTGLPEDVIRRILLLIDFMIYTSEGKRTKFAKDNGIWTYYDLYNFLKRHIEDFTNEDFVNGISIRYNKLQKSLYGRVGSWIYKSYIVKSDEFKNMDDKDKVITANLYGISFINRTYGQLLQMVVDNPKSIVEIFRTLDKSKTEVQKLVSGENYQRSKEDEDFAKEMS